MKSSLVFSKQPRCLVNTRVTLCWDVYAHGPARMLQSCRIGYKSRTMIHPTVSADSSLVLSRGEFHVISRYFTRYFFITVPGTYEINPKSNF